MFTWNVLSTFDIDIFCYIMRIIANRNFGFIFLNFTTSLPDASATASLESDWGQNLLQMNHQHYQNENLNLSNTDYYQPSTVLLHLLLYIAFLLLLLIIHFCCYNITIIIASWFGSYLKEKYSITAFQWYHIFMLVPYLL